MNQAILYTLAGLGMSLAGFSGLAVKLTTPDGGRKWSPVQLRMLGLLIGDSFLVLFLALLPVLPSLAGWSKESTWGFCSAVLGIWFILGDFLALRGESRDRRQQQSTTNPLTKSVRYSIYVAALVMGAILLLSVWNVVFVSGQALYVLGLMLLLAFAAVEFLFFILLAVRRETEG